MTETFSWTPGLLSHLLDGYWVNQREFTAEKIVTAIKSPLDGGALFVAYTDATFRRYMGDCNFVYFAPQGRRFGNLAAAQRAGRKGLATAMIVERELNAPVAQFVVRDSFAALEALAQHKRSVIRSPVIAVTGTVGKSSTLKALDTVLERSHRLSRSNVRRSLALGMANAPIGDKTDFLLAEVSVSALWGENGGSSQFLRPNVAVLTEIGLGMTHRVPTVRNTAEVKTNLINAMPPDGVLLYNADMEYADYVHKRGGRQPVNTRSFGFNENADYRIVDKGLHEAANGALHQQGAVHFAAGSRTFSLPAIGAAHLYANAAGLAVVDILGEDTQTATTRTVKYRPSKTSERVTRIHDDNLDVNHHIVDGTFSATPVSMLNSFRLAAQIHNHRVGDRSELVGVLGRVVALGDQAEETHRSFAPALLSAGFDRIYTYGPDMSLLVEDLKGHGLHAGHFEDTSALAQALTKELSTGTTILIKGSKRASDFRTVRSELRRNLNPRIVAYLVEVTGNVQGVGYRRWARWLAHRLGAVGWARNSGSNVELHIQGPAEIVDEILSACRQGPDAAEVADVFHEEVSLDELTRFRIRRTVHSQKPSKPSKAEGPASTGERRSSTTAFSSQSVAPAGFEPEIVKQAFGSQKLSAFVLALESWRRGLCVTFDSPDGTHITIGDNIREISFNGSRSSLTTQEAIRVVENKNLTLTKLRAAGVPTPRSRLYHASGTTFEDLLTIVTRDYSWPVVLKPVRGSRGDGVFANIASADELRESYYHLTQELGIKRFLLEEHRRGQDYRVYVVGNQVIGACRRTPANLIGDGTSTVRQLVIAKNSQRRQNPFLSKGLIRRDLEIDNMLRRQGLDYHAIPEAGQYVQLRQKANASAGGDVEDVTVQIPEAVKKAATTAVQAIDGLAAAGVDVLMDNNAESPGSSFVVIELNARAHIGVNMYPSHGAGADVPRAIIDHFFPETTSPAEPYKKTLGLNLSSLLGPLRDASASNVRIAKLPEHGYPVRRQFETSGPISITTTQQRSILRASRRLGIAGLVESGPRTTRLIVAGEEVAVATFTERVKTLLKAEFCDGEDWPGPISMGFYFCN